MVIFQLLTASLHHVAEFKFTAVSLTNYGLAWFEVVASQTWETIPMEVKCLPYNVFKKKYKLFLLDSQT